MAVLITLSGQIYRKQNNNNNYCPDILVMRLIYDLFDLLIFTDIVKLCIIN